MSKQEDYASDSDESDEDFCPDKANNSDVPSEEDSDDPISENEDVPASASTKTKSKTKKKPTQNRQSKKTNKEPVVEEENHVVATRNRSETSTKSSLEKDDLESDDEDSSRKEALWADFLSDIPTTTPSRINKSAATNKKETDKETRVSIEKKATPVVSKEPEKTVIKEIFDFAGEEVVVEKTVSADSIKANGSKKNSAHLNAPRGSIKRPGGGGGLGSILGQIEKKKKISVLDKTKLDWDSFKTTEGIDEDLQTFNKGKDGYLQRQDFLERTDLRQFEIEKSLRASRRKPM